MLSLIQLRFYRRYATPHPPALRLPKGWKFTAQVSLHLVLPALALVNLAARHLVSGSPPVYGYEVLSLLSSLATWPTLLALVFVERRYQVGRYYNSFLPFLW